MVLGIDIGSCYTKAVLFDGQIKEKMVIKTSLRPVEAIEQVKEKLTGYKEIAATGYGRNLIHNAQKVITEITAFAYGAMYIEPGIKTIIDIGGQDSKVIKLNRGVVERFVMNDRCAAGTGNFIEKTARALDLSLESFGQLAVKSDKPETIDSLCVVMAETEILSLAAENKKLEDIVAGLCDALVRRIAALGAQVKIEPPILLCGGGALNQGIIKSMNRILGKVIVPEAPQFLGALGAALCLNPICRN